MKKIICVFSAVILIITSLVFSASSAAKYKTVESVKYLIEGNTATVYKYMGKGGTVRIPETVSGKKVTKIGNQAFAEYYTSTPNSKRIKKLYLPSTVNQIGNQAFLECRLLSFVEAKGVTAIGDHAFRYCDGLTKLITTKALKSVGKGAFYNCKKLTVYSDSNSFAKRYATANSVKFSTLYPESITLFSYSIELNSTTQIGVECEPADCLYQSFKWSTSNKKIATVTSKGQVKGIAYGTAVITCKSKYGKAVASCTVTVGLGKPENLQVENVGFKSYTLSWDNVKGADGYKIQKYTGSKWQNYAKTKSTVYDVVNLKVGSSAMYRVKAYDSTRSGTVYGKYSDKVTAETLKLQGVTGVKFSTNGTDFFTFTWDKVKGAKGYEIFFYNEDCGAYEYITSVKNNLFSFTELTPGSVVKMKVRAYAKVGSETLYGSSSKAAAFSTKPNKVYGLTQTSKANDAVTFSWQETTGATGYVIYKVENDKKIKVMTLTETSYTFTKLERNTEISCCVRAYTKANLNTSYGEYSNIVKGKSDSVLQDKKEITQELLKAYTNTISENKLCIIKEKTVTSKLQGCTGEDSALNALTAQAKSFNSSEQNTYIFTNGVNKEYDLVPAQVLCGESEAFELTNDMVSSALYERDGSGFLITLTLKSETEFLGTNPTANEKTAGCPNWEYVKDNVPDETPISNITVTYPATVIKAKVNGNMSMDTLTITQNYTARITSKYEKADVLSVVTGKRVFDYIISR